MYSIQMVPLDNNNRIQGAILAGLLVVLLILGILILFRPHQTEGYVDMTTLALVNVSDISQPTLNLSSDDIKNGYYVSARDPVTRNATQKGQLPYGYYKVDDTTMAKVPYGYEVAKQGGDTGFDYMRQIIPLTNSRSALTSNYQGINKRDKTIPANGDIPDGYYKKTDTTMEFVLPNTKPNITHLDVSGTKQNPILIKTFDIGYVSDTEYYSKKYTLTRIGLNKVGTTEPEHTIVDISINRIGNLVSSGTSITPIQYPTGLVFPLPEGVYYSAPTLNNNIWRPDTIQFLPYGKIPKTLQSSGEFLYGYINNPNLITVLGNAQALQNIQTYRDISNNYDVEFHESAEDLAKKQDTNGDSTFGDITVLDKDGNLVTLPRATIQGDITYYSPGAYTFGAGTYVPKYEDSVYLSRTSHLPTMAEYRSAFQEVGFCEADKMSPEEIETKCNALDKSTCASTSCCALLGGAKCVAGNANGPTKKSNYSDLRVRNHDYYMHMGKCYGNCP